MMRRASWLLVFSIACHKAEESKPTPAPSPAPAPAGTATPAAAGKEKGPLAWIHDDYAAAVAQAKAQKKPIFVDMWARWCHTCLSMQSFVLADPSMAAEKDKYVWLAIDTEKRGNAAVVKKLPLDNWPTFFLVDPDSEKVLGRRVGAMSLAELRQFLAGGGRAFAEAHGTPGRPDDPMMLELAGHDAAEKGDWAGAAERYRGALDKVGKNAPERAGLLASWMQALHHLKQPDKCVEAAMPELAALPHLPNGGDVLAYAVGCADELPKDDARAAKVHDLAVEQIPVIAGDADAPLSADDRQDMWRMQKDLLEQKGDKAGARAAMEKRYAVLEEAAAKAPDAESRATFDATRADTDLYLERGPEAVKMLEKSEADLPDDYDRPARLARVHLTLGHYGEALAAIDRALAKGYGPRKGLFYGLKAEILEKQGQTEEAKKVLTEALAYMRDLPDGQKSPGTEGSLEKRLAALGAAAKQ